MEESSSIEPQSFSQSVLHISGISIFDKKFPLLRSKALHNEAMNPSVLCFMASWVPYECFNSRFGCGVTPRHATGDFNRG
jgi:hypothetical protein